MMAVSLYTSRVVLRVLGAEEYGLYNVIGGIIAMFGFLNGAMTNTTSRYITFFLGQKNFKRLSDVFSMSFIIHATIALIIILLGETIGLWYLYEKLVIPDGRFQAAFWLYQLSIASAVIGILYVPFNATIIAHEKMSAFAYISILDAILKLSIVFALIHAPYDKLIFYGVLIFFVQIIDIAIYFGYCKIKFKETKLHFYWDSRLFKEMFGFAGWSLLGNFSFFFFNQGINLMLNAFCGPAVNAARGIAVQVDGVIKNFASNVQTAINPQIIKSYAENNHERMFTLVFASSRFCFYLLFVLSLPVMVEASSILQLWLGQVPDHTVNFIRITLANVILDAIVNPMFTTNLATGKVKIYHICISIISYGFMPITYFAIKYSLLPESVFVCTLSCTVIGIIARIFIIKSQVGMPISTYMKKVLLPIFIVTMLSATPAVCIHNILPQSFTSSIISITFCVFSVIASTYFWGITKQERTFVNKKILEVVSKHAF
ncbi:MULTISPECIES: lipopolysaccharide biosynthesis protein [unclassified Fibrobacter]|uniref:lipopolysaccharide biosynthesis protein n=1 Tax=unclassified Fibrobacter TaxID=2634177 RepID=UPI000D7A4093|nr:MULTISPECIES: lipopolysaccharide biosynthesis protein [unclassified Fibrobacter]PWJ61059.1 Na+-driven multidrug efflux pump [Fibrobacter sp. UWR4]PZW68080.1 Na+-driven multidrug efflux pump [Fibrobacter sp. UWR1]